MEAVIQDNNLGLIDQARNSEEDSLFTGGGIKEKPKLKVKKTIY